MKNFQTFKNLYQILSNYVVADDSYHKTFSILVAKVGIPDIDREIDIGIFDALVYGLNKVSAPIIENVFTKMDDLLYKDVFNHVERISITKSYRKNLISFFFNSPKVAEIISNDRSKTTSIAEIFYKYGGWMPQKIMGLINEKKQLPSLIIKGDFQKINAILNDFPQDLFSIVGQDLVSNIEIKISHDHCISDDPIYKAIKTMDIMSLEENENAFKLFDFWKYSYHLVGTPVDNYLHVFFSNLRKASEMLVRKFKLSEYSAYQLLYSISFFSLISGEELTKSTRYFVENSKDFPYLKPPDTDLSNKVNRENLLSTAFLFLSPYAFNELKDTLSPSNFELMKNIALERGFSYFSSLLKLAEDFNALIDLRSKMRKVRRDILKLKNDIKKIFESMDEFIKELNSGEKDNREARLKEFDNLIRKISDFAGNYQNQYLSRKVNEIAREIKIEKKKYLERRKFIGGYKVNRIDFVSWLSEKCKVFVDELQTNYLKNSKFWPLIESMREAYKRFFKPAYLLDDLTNPVDDELVKFIKDELAQNE